MINLDNYKSKLSTGLGISSSNYFSGRPTGIVIEDTYNNPIFPIPNPILDTDKCNLPMIMDQFFTLYTKIKDKSSPLPWHYVVEMIDRYYTIHATKPLTQRYPFNNKDCSDIITKNNIKIDEKTSDLLKSNNDKSNFIHILIIGNSEYDVYTKEIYEKIGQAVISPLSQLYKFHQINNVLLLNTGKQFKQEYLNNYVRK